MNGRTGKKSERFFGAENSFETKKGEWAMKKASARKPFSY